MYRLLFFIFVLLRVIETSASIEISGVFPNTVDDTNLEWLELHNTECERVDITQYSISDLSGKKYTFPSGTSIDSHATFRLERPISKIVLNNDVETLFLYDTSSTLIESFSYKDTTKGVPIYDTSILDKDCTPPLPPSDTGSIIPTSGTGSGNWTGSTTGSWGISTGSGSSPTDTGSLSGSGSTWGDSGSGSAPWGSSTGTTDPSLSASGSNPWTWATVVPPIFVSETGVLLPEKMYYSDSDGNSKIDTLEIYYPYVLTGNVNTGSIALYSASWWLSITKIDTKIGFVLSGSLSGNILILSIQEGDIEKIHLKITNSTSSELRLKSSGNLGFTSIGGKLPEPFFLITSFGNYLSIFPKPLLGGGVGGVPPEEWSGAASISSGSSQPTLSGWSLSWVSFPELIPILQSPSNAIFSGGVFSCDPKNLPCRINLTLESLFTGSFLPKNYTCRIISWTGTYDSCNPNTLYYVESGSLILSIFHKASWKEVMVTFPVIFNNNPSIASFLNAWYTNHPPVPVLEYDGKWKSYFDEPSEHHLICYAMTCSVNFTGQKSYDPDGDAIRFLWIYDFQATKTSKDPWTYTFTRWFHRIILRVIDTAWAWAEIQYTIDVVGPKALDSEYKGDEFEWITIPEILLQTESDTIYASWSSYICETQKSKCSLNFSLEHTTKNAIYEWVFPNQSGAYISKNPRSYAFPLGKSDVSVLMKDETGSIIWEQVLSIEVIGVPSRTTNSSQTKKKMRAIVFFDPPNLMLQSEKPEIELLGNTYFCRTKLKYCSINFSLEGIVPGYTYEWYFAWEKDPYISKNPRSFRFPLGKKSTRLLVRDGAGNQIWSQEFITIVSKILKKKKVKSKSSHSRNKEKLPLVTLDRWWVTAVTPENSIPDEGLLLFLLGSGALTGKILRRKLNT